MLTGRVTEANAKTLKSWADEAGLPMYQAVVRALEVGISSLTKGYDHNLSTAEAGKLIDMPRLDIQALVQSMRRLVLIAMLCKNVDCFPAASRRNAYSTKTGQHEQPRRGFGNGRHRRWDRERRGNGNRSTDGCARGQANIVLTAGRNSRAGRTRKQERKSSAGNKSASGHKWYVIILCERIKEQVYCRARVQKIVVKEVEVSRI